MEDSCYMEENENDHSMAMDVLENVSVKQQDSSTGGSDSGLDASISGASDIHTCDDLTLVKDDNDDSWNSDIFGITDETDAALEDMYDEAEMRELQRILPCTEIQTSMYEVMKSIFQPVPVVDSMEIKQENSHTFCDSDSLVERYVQHRVLLQSSSSQSSCDGDKLVSGGGKIVEWKHNGYVRWSDGTESRLRIDGDNMKYGQVGKILWADGSSAEMVLEPIGLGNGYFPSENLEEITADSPLQMAEAAVGLAFATAFSCQPPQECNPLFFSKFSGGMMDSSSVTNGVKKYTYSISHEENQPKRRRSGRPRKVVNQSVGLVEKNFTSGSDISEAGTSDNSTSDTMKMGKKRRRGRRRVWSKYASADDDVAYDPAIIVDATEEPAVCKRCQLTVAGRDHFDRFHNGLLMEEQGTFSVEDKRVRWNSVIKKKLRLRCQKPDCQKTVNSSTAMRYHESTCGMKVKKEECPKCKRRVAASYMHQHLMGHNREAGKFTRPRRKVVESDEPTEGSTLRRKRKVSEMDGMNRKSKWEKVRGE